MKELLELAKVYRMSTDSIIKYIYIPAFCDKIRNLFHKG